jgi:F-box and leucine-rich repeat protein GRR1
LEIDLENCHRLEDDAVTALISEGASLRELRLVQCVRITDNAFLNLPSGITFDGLRVLDLTSCQEIQDVGVQRIVEAAPRLRNLVLNKCRRITDRAISAITRLGKNLHYIHLGHCSQITDAGLQQLIRQCNRIRYIDLANCTNLTDVSVTQLAQLPRLKRVGLVKCGNITDLSIYALASPRQISGQAPPSPTSVVPSSLERVHLSYCTELTLDGITALLNNCPRVSHLSLTGIEAFLREDLLCFCRDAPPQFNELQRDRFCVFSGAGVGRLRNFLNDQAQAARFNMENDVNDVDMPDADSAQAQISSIGHRHRLDVPPAPPMGPTSMPPVSPIPPRPHSLPNVFTNQTGQASRPRDLPPLQIPTRVMADAASPTNDQPLSVDEGEEFENFPDARDVQREIDESESVTSGPSTRPTHSIP